MTWKAFIIHGAYGSSQENWFPWLAEELSKIGMTVFVPDFPTPEDQNLDNWLKVFEKFFPELDDKTIFAAHSLGPAFVLNVLEKIDQTVLACFFVSGFTGLLGLDEFDSINHSITNREFQYSTIKSNCRHFILYNSDNDPYVPLSKGEMLEKALSAKLNVIKKGGHINKGAGFTEFPQLLEDIKELLRRKGANLNL